jgi:hypothetical protein
MCSELDLDEECYDPDWASRPVDRRLCHCACGGGPVAREPEADDDES